MAKVNDPHGIWYTPVTGIWQTVWLEPVPETYIKDLKITPDIDKNILLVEAITNINTTAKRIEVKVKEGKSVVATAQSINNEPVEIAMPQNAKLWSPNNPHLYDLEVIVWDGNNLIRLIAMQL